MRERNQTTVVLSENAQIIKEDLAPVFGLKNILSAGLVLLNLLDAEQQKAIINLALGKSSLTAEDARNAVSKAAAHSAVLTGKKRARRPKP